MKILIDLNNKRVRSEMIFAYLKSKGINPSEFKDLSWNGTYREDDVTLERYYKHFTIYIEK